MIAVDLNRYPLTGRAGGIERPRGLAVANRVLHLVNGDLYSGAERVQDLLAVCLPEFGFDVGFACLKAGQFARLRVACTAPLHSVPMRNRLDLRVARSLIRLTRCAGYRLLHAHTPRTAVIGRIVSQVTGVPFIYHVHSPALRESTHRLRNRLNRAIEAWSVRAAARLIAVSRSLQQQMQAAGLPAERVRYVPNGVPTRGPFRLPVRPAGVWTLGTVGWFRPRKGLEVLLQALAELNRINPGTIRLRAVGAFESPAYEVRTKCLARGLGLSSLIDWIGFTRDVPRELAQMDLFVLPSLFGEGMPMVVLESMAAGVPVVATRVEGVPDVIRDGRDGLLVAPGSPADLTQGITRIRSGQLDWSALRDSARRRQTQRFSDRAMAEGVARVYNEVLRETSGDGTAGEGRALGR